MKAHETSLLEFLRKSAQFIIPIYQRTYSWTGKQCEQLWNDIVRAGEDDAIPGHFVGSVVYVEKDYTSILQFHNYLLLMGSNA